MSLLEEEYLKNTRRVYNDFCNRANNYELAKEYIDNIPAEYMARYREIILAEHDSCIQNDEATIEFFTSVILSALVSALVSSAVQTTKFAIPFAVGMFLVAVIFPSVRWNFIGNTKKRQKTINVSVMIGYLKTK